MNNIFEDKPISFNCSIGGNDEPFFIPLDKYDPIFLRLQIPQVEILLNGGVGSLPSASKVQLYATDEVGTNIYDYQQTSNMYALGRIENSGHSEYQFLFPNFNTNFYKLNPSGLINVGDVIEYTTLNGEYYIFEYGVDRLPPRFYQITTNTDELMLVDDNVPTGSILVYVNQTLVPVIKLFSKVSFSTINCFRFKIDVQFSESGHDLEFYTKPFKVMICEDTSLLEGIYPLNTIDCEKHIHQSAFGCPTLVGSIIPNYLRFRVYGDVQSEPNKIKKTYNSKWYNSKSERIKKHTLKSEPMPEWYCNEIENLISAKDFRVNGTNYVLDNSETITENTDILTTYKNINVPLSSSKCEIVFVCQ